MQIPEPMPSFQQLVLLSYRSLTGAVRSCTDCGWELSRRTWAENARLAWSDALLLLLCTFAWTPARRAATRCFFRPIAKWCQLHPKDAAKMPESAWKLAFYSFSWSYSTYLLFFAGYPFFHDPPSAFYGWEKGMKVPMDIAVAYLMQASFYGHSIYATLYMDAWRKDSIVMLLHHLVTLILIAFSYIFRYHNIGILALFLHDVNDIQLEFTKLNVYFRNRCGAFHRLNSIFSNAGSISFCISWFWFRLYWFPLKVLYATCHTSIQSVPDIPFYFFFNALLFALLLMNIYWFLYIIVFVTKVLLGQLQEVNDVREYDIDASKKKEREFHLHNSWKDGNHVKNGIMKDKRL